MFVIKVSKVLLVFVLHMMSICVSTTPKQVLKARKGKKSSVPVSYKNTSRVHSKHLENTITEISQTISSSTEMALETQ